MHPYNKTTFRTTAAALPSLSSTPSLPLRQQSQHQSQPIAQQHLNQPTATAPRPKHGQIPLSGLLPKRNGPIYGKTINRQQQHPPHNLPHNSPLQAASPPATISFSPPAQQQQPKVYTSGSTVTTGHPNSSQPNNPPTCITTTKNTSTAATVTQTSGIHFKKTDSDPKHLKHSTFDSIRRHTIADLTDRKHHLSPVVVASRTPTTIGFDYTQNNPKHFANSYGGDHEFSLKNKPRPTNTNGRSLGKSIPTPLYRKNSISSTCSSSASSSPPSSTTFCSSHLDLLPSASDSLFAHHPIKVEVKQETTTTSETACNVPAEVIASDCSVVSRSKRSYSESSHHEALQRIHPAKQIKIEDDVDEAKPDVKANLQKNEHNVVVSYVEEKIPRTRDTISSLGIQQCWFTNEARFACRDQRLDHKLSMLRRQLVQYTSAQKSRSIAMARKQVQLIRKALKSDEEM